MVLFIFVFFFFFFSSRRRHTSCALVTGVQTCALPICRGASASVSADTPGTPWPIRILHLHSSFSLGGKEARAVRLMNLMGDRAHHSILSAMPGALGARDAIDPAIIVDFPKDAPPLHGKPSLGRYRDLANYMTRFDLVLSHNWGAMDGEIGRAHV